MKTSARRPFIAGNWKMHKTVAEALALVAELRAQLDGLRTHAEIAVAPAFTALHPVAAALAGERGGAGGAELPLGGLGGVHRARSARPCCARWARAT